MLVFTISLSLSTNRHDVYNVFLKPHFKDTAIGLTHVLLKVAFAETSTHFDWLLYFSYNYGELGRDIKNTLETQACLVFHAICTVRFQLVIVLVITFFAVQ